MIDTMDNTNIKEARVIHFTSQRKPWEANHVLLTIPKFSVYHSMYDMWQSQWNEFLHSLNALPEVIK